MSHGLHVNVKGDARVPLMDVSGAFTTDPVHPSRRRTQPEAPSRAPAPTLGGPSPGAAPLSPPDFAFRFPRQRPAGALTAAPSPSTRPGNEMNNVNRFPSSKLKLDEFFLNWLSSPESQKLVRPDPRFKRDPTETTPARCVDPK